MTALLADKGCLVRRLLGYFGEEHGRDCGHCGPCAGEPAVKLDRALPVLNLPAAALGKLRAQHPEALKATRQVTRFLCGIAAPALTKAKLTRHPEFGSAGHVPFAHVAAAVKALSA